MAARTPHEYRNAAEIAAALRRHQPVIDAWFMSAPEPLTELLRTAVSGNTWRGFQLMPHRPSVIGKQWIMRYFLSPNRQEAIRELTTQGDFDNWHESCFRSFARHWRQTMDKELPIGRGYKVVNLVMKAYVRGDNLANAERQRLITYLHVPLDRYALVGIRQFLPRFRIRGSSTMSFVQDATTYQDLQAEIRRITEPAGYPPIYYDWLAWNQRH